MRDRDNHQGGESEKKRQKSEVQQPLSILDLSDDILRKIFVTMPFAAVKTIPLVCKIFSNAIANHQYSFWNRYLNNKPSADDDDQFEWHIRKCAYTGNLSLADIEYFSSYAVDQAIDRRRIFFARVVSSISHYEDFQYIMNRIYAYIRRMYCFTEYEANEANGYLMVFWSILCNQTNDIEWVKDNCGGLTYHSDGQIRESDINWLMCIGWKYYSDTVIDFLIQFANADKYEFSRKLLYRRATTLNKAALLHRMMVNNNDFDQILEKDDGFTPLMIACAMNSVECATILLECGANPVATTMTGYDPIALAVISGSIGIVKILIEHGAGYNGFSGRYTKRNLNLKELADDYGHEEISCYLGYRMNADFKAIKVK